MDDPNVRMGYAVIMVMEMDKFCKQNSRVGLDAAFEAAAANINQKAQADPDYQKSQRDRAETTEIFGPHGIIAVGSFRYSVEKSYWRESVKQYPHDLVFPDGIFLFVEIGIMNVDRQELAIPQFTLKDLAGREYGTTSKAWFLRNRLSGFERLNPGIWKFATIVFDVPRQAYRLQITGGYGSQQRALISSH